jgi:single-stranded DNA-specific DHH superfamily exonuclease
MLTKKQIKEIKEHLDKAQNPLFLFDNDQDGLCSFLLLQRYILRGKGFPVKQAPMTKDYFRRIDELNPDYVFILDVPDISEDFWKEVEQVNLPIVWIDHHEKDLKKIPDFVSHYNPVYNRKKSNEPVTALCYQISEKKEDLWLSIIGNISDKNVPRNWKDFKKDFPELVIDSDDASEIYYNSGIGKISQMFGYGLKDKTTNVIQMLKFLMKAKGPHDILEESKNTIQIHKRYDEIRKKYLKLIEKAKSEVDDSKVLFFKYGGDTSMSAEVSNGLRFAFPDKYIIVAFVKEARVNLSGRGENVREFFVKALESFENARGGGHPNAVGGQISSNDLESFREKLVGLIEKD